jgi:intracellular septation protein
MSLATPKKPPLGPGQRLAIDIGPIAIFFLVNFLTRGPDLFKLLVGTTAFMVASAAAMIFSLWRAGRISPMLWLTGILVLGFGSLTLYFHDQLYIQLKPTFIYGALAAILAFGLATDRPLLQYMLEAAYPGLTPIGWRKLTINWTVFFVFLAVLNEVIRREWSFPVWLGAKVWLFIPLTLVFAIANVPMLMKHGLSMGDEPPIPPQE